MKIGLLAHIAGNPLALAAADTLFTEHGVEARVCLGDIVGIYPFVEQCVEILVGKRYKSIKSFVDDTFSRGGPYDLWSARYLVESLEYCRGITTDACIEFLHGLEFDARFRELRLVSQFQGNTSNVYVNTTEDARQAFASFPERIVFHAAIRHASVLYEQDLRRPGELVRDFVGYEAHAIRADTRVLISSGGIGSRYRGPLEGPSAVIYDDASDTLEILHVDWRPASLHERLEASAFPPPVLAALRSMEYEHPRRR